MKHLDDIPVWLFALLTVVTFDVTALVGLVCTRWLGHAFGLYVLLDNNTVGWVFSAILVMYAIAIGLIAIATWGNASNASATASQEASHIVTLYRNLAGYPELQRSEFTRAIFTYTQVMSRMRRFHYPKALFGSWQNAVKTAVIKITMPNLNFDHSGQNAFWTTVESMVPAICPRWAPIKPAIHPAQPSARATSIAHSTL